MRQITLILDYDPIDTLLDLIDEPYRSICVQILEDNRKLFETAPGSTHNHQTWKGGYIDHIVDGMNFARLLYQLLAALHRDLPLSLSDVFLIFFIHDLEKPWRILVNQEGEASNREGLTTKEEYKEFRDAKLVEYGLVLTPMQRNAFTYIEGEGKDYTSLKRMMEKLAAVCHMVDTYSARVAPEYPKPHGEDEWIEAGRFRTV